MALWRTRTLAPDQTVQIVEEQQDNGEIPVFEDAGSVVGVEDAKTSRVYVAELPFSVSRIIVIRKEQMNSRTGAETVFCIIQMDSMMELFKGGTLEQKVMEKSGCLNYTTTSWEPVQPGVSERRVSYRFNRSVSIFGGEVTSIQQKSSNNGDEKIVNEVMSLSDVPFADHFRVCKANTFTSHILYFIL